MTEKYDSSMGLISKAGLERLHHAGYVIIPVSSLNNLYLEHRSYEQIIHEHKVTIDRSNVAIVQSVHRIQELQLEISDLKRQLAELTQPESENNAQD